MHISPTDLCCMDSGTVEEVNIFFLNIWLEVTNRRTVEKYTILTPKVGCLSHCQAVTIAQLQQVTDDMKEVFRKTLEIEARIQDTLVFQVWRRIWGTEDGI